MTERVDIADRLVVYVGDCRESLRQMGAGSVQCCVTSPPYYGLRDYGHDGQIGLEQTPDEYVQALVDVFREVRRVLRDDGVLWLNLGDSYGSGKQLMGIPWRVAFALQADGWYLRQDIIWAKPNPMPESVTDRCTKAHEYIFLLSKSPSYYYDAEAVKEAVTESTIARLSQDIERQVGTTRANGGAKTNGNLKAVGDPQSGRNRRSVWTIATQPYAGAHFATFPPKLIEPCILAGTSERGQCPHCGAPWVRVVKTPDFTEQPKRSVAKMPRTDRTSAGQAWQKWRGENPNVTTGWQPSCACPAHDPVPQTVLDPFGGSGTTAGVALKHYRRAVLCELNPEYAALVEDRVHNISDALRQYALFEEVAL